MGGGGLVYHRGLWAVSAMNIYQLQNRVEELEEEVRQLREALTPLDEVPAEWGLNPAEKRLYLTLAKGGVIRRSACVYAVTEGRDIGSKILDVRMHYLRRKLAPSGFVIINIFGEGYELKRDEVHAGLLQGDRA